MEGEKENKNQNKSSDWWLFTIAVISFIFVLFIYFLNFGLSGKVSDKNEVWGQFADFVGGLMNPLLSIIVLWTLIKTLRFNSEAVTHSSSAIEEAKQSRLAEETRIKRQNAFDFSLTFQSEDMMQSRLAASRLLKRNSSNSYKLKDMENASKDYVHLAKVLNSFRQLNVLRNNNLIDESLSKELFGSYYVHFREYFDLIIKAEELGSSKGLLAQIKELETWMPHDYYD
jgi:fumarate reductase subunit C